MIKLEIIVQPKSVKYLEFTQTLEAIKSDLQKHCIRLTVIEKEKSFSITADLESDEQLKAIINSKEISILLGAIKLLGEKSKIIIIGSSLKNKTTDLKEIRLKYQKQLRKIIN